MAIKLPDPGNGIPEQKTGNDEWTNMKIVRDNFADQSNAASRSVGTESGNLPVMTSYGLENTGILGTRSRMIGTNVDDISLRNGVYTYQAEGSLLNVAQYSAVLHLPYSSPNHAAQLMIKVATGEMYVRSAAGSWGDLRKIYDDKNTTKEENTGYLIASSPVLKVQHNDFEKVHEAEQLDIEVQNIKTGVYEIKGSTGLREGDGWNLKPPKDVNGNVLCICEASEKGGVITLKTYKKKFDFETVSIVADYEQPTDIPEGAVVLLRFNELPQEELDEPVI